MWLPLALIIALAGSTLCVDYEIRGNIDIISNFDIDEQYFDEKGFTAKHDLVEERFGKIIGDEFEGFNIFDVKIHGKRTAVFHAILTLKNEIDREVLVEKIMSTPDVQIYFLKKTTSPAPRRFTMSKLADVTYCVNGGILLPNATCTCPPYRSGPNCATVTCRNGGIVENGRCACPPGIYSEHCEPRTCVANIASSVDLSWPSVVLVVNTRASMAYDLNTIISNLQTLVDDYNNQGVYPMNYILTIYRYSKTVYFMETTVYSLSDDLISYLQHVIVGASTEDQQHIDALLAAQSTSNVIRPQSTVYLFADSEDHTAPTPTTTLSQTNESMLIQQTLAWRNRLVLVLSQWTSSPLSPIGNYFDVLRRVVTATHGDLLIVDKTELPEVISHLFYYYIGGQNFFVQYYNNGSAVIPLNSDTNTTNSYILVTVENGATLPTVQDVFKNVLTPVSSGARFALYRTQLSVTSQVTVNSSSMALHNIRVWFQSTDTVLISYSNDDSIDNGHAYTFSAYSQRPTLYSTFAGTTGIQVSRLDPTTSKATLGASIATSRSSDCIFQYQLDTVASSTAGPFVHYVIVTTSTGTYYRALPGYSFTPQKQTGPALSCMNNGTLSGTACVCTPNFRGGRCETPICQNGGTVDNFPNGNGRGNCICPYGVQGSFCEIINCSSMSPDEFESYDRTFSLVIQNSLSVSTALQKLNDGLKIMLDNGKSTDFSDFILTTYRNRVVGKDTLPEVYSQTTSSAGSFINMTTFDDIGFAYSPDGAQPGLLALETTMKSMSYDKSSIFFFTDSPSTVNDSSKNFTDIVQTAVERQLEISIIVVAPYGSVDLCKDAGSYEIYELLAVQTGGNFINLCQPYTTSGDPVFNFVASYGISHHHTEVVTYTVVPDCTNYLSMPFYVSDVNSEVNIVVYSPTIQNFSAQAVEFLPQIQQSLIPDAHSVPFFASFPLKISSNSTLVYTLNLQSSTPGECFVRVTERSQFSVYLGFSPDPSVDRYSKYLTYALPQTPVVHLSSVLQTDPQVGLEMYDNSGTNMYSSGGVKRTSGCKYEYVESKQFVCATPESTFTTGVSVVTSQVTIQRTQRAYCGTLQTCLNGGILFSTGCTCPVGYGGLYCEVPTCLNGGSVVDFKCVCAKGYDGARCQNVQCLSWNFLETHDPRDSIFQQITFVVEVNTNTMAIANSILKLNIGAYFDATDDTNRPKVYTLITFDDQDVNVVVSSAHRDVFVNAFQKAMTIDTRTPTTVRSVAALKKAYDTIVDLPGTINLFTTTAPTNENLVETMRQRFGVQVNVIYLGTQASQYLPQNISPYLSAPARQSNGRIITSNSAFTKNILAYLQTAVYENQLIMDDAAQVCTGSGVQFSFPVEELATSLVFVATGSNVKIAILDGSYNPVYVGNTTSLSDVNSVISTVNTTARAAGNWSVTVTSDSSCYLQVRAVTPLQVVAGFTNDQQQDSVSPIPRVGAGASSQSFITFRIQESYDSSKVNYGSTVASVESISTDLQAPWLGAQTIHYSSANPRDPVGCASQWVTPLVTWTDTYEKFLITGTDSMNAPYQRTFFFNKIAAATDCLNGATVDQYGFCQCGARYTGSLCQNRICQNGGTSAYGLCDCPNGYYGLYCEQWYTL